MMKPPFKNSTPPQAMNFHDLMRMLLESMHIQRSPGPPPEVYRLTFDGSVDVSLASRQPGMLEVIARLGVVRNLNTSSVLLNLLALNQYTIDGPCLTIGVDPRSGLIALWSRLSLSGLGLDELRTLLELVLERATCARQALVEQSAVPKNHADRGNHQGLRGNLNAAFLSR